MAIAAVLALPVVTGTHQGTFAGVPATDKRVSWHSCNVVEVKNGKANSSRIYAGNVTRIR
jgi:predicted ester cyclase